MPDGAKFPGLQGLRLLSSAEVRAGEGASAPVRITHPDPGWVFVYEPAQAIPRAWYRLDLEYPPDALVNVLAKFDFANGSVLWQRLPAIGRNQFAAHLRFEDALVRLTLIVTGSGRLIEPARCSFVRVGMSGQIAAAARRGREIVRRDGVGVVFSGLNYLWRLARGGSISLSRGSAAKTGEPRYETWARLFDEHPERDIARHRERLASLRQQPLVSILAVVSSTDASALDRLARSASQQIYPAWELVVAAPSHLHHDVGAMLADRGVEVIRLRIANSETAEADGLNAALAVAGGEYVLPLSDSTILRAHALLDLMMTAACVPDATLIYADEDRIDAAGRRTGWRFKPAWSPEVLEAVDYIGQPALMRPDAVRALGGWRGGTGGTPQHDLMVRLGTAAGPTDVVHLAKVLAHDVAGQGVRAPTRVKIETPCTRPRVSLIIPTRDNADLLATCVRSIRQKTRYDNYEILIVDNGSVEEKTKALFALLANDKAIRILPRAEPFNFSRLNNAAAGEATGEILGLINNDIEVTHEDWLDKMVALAARPEIGCVGAKLLYPDGRMQHGGIVLGLYTLAGHAHRFARGDEPGYLDRLRAVQNVSAVTAACLLVRKSVYDQVGGLDETLAVAFNDVDFCLKVRAAGYRNVWTPFAELIHHESVSRGRDFTPAKADRFAGEYATMQQRWGKQLFSDPYYSPHLTLDAEDFSPRLR